MQRVLQRQTLTPGCHANYMRDALFPLHTREPVPMVNSSTAGSHEMATSKTVTKSTLIMLQTQLCFSQYHLFFGQTLPTGHRTGMIQKNHLPKSSLPSTHSSGNSPNTTHLDNLHAAMIKVRCRTALVAKSCQWVASMPRWHLGDDSKNTQHTTANVL